MPLVRILGASARTGCAALAVALVSLGVTAVLAGRGSARLGWLLPLHTLAVAVVFGAATVVFHRSTASWLPSPGRRWVATVLHAAAMFAALIGVVLVSLVALNR